MNTAARRQHFQSSTTRGITSNLYTHSAILLPAQPDHSHGCNWFGAAEECYSAYSGEPQRRKWEQAEAGMYVWAPWRGEAI